MGGGARPRDFQRPVGARLASHRIQRDGERASTGRAGPQCRVGHGARSVHALTASSFSMNWNGAGAGQRPAHRQPDETPSTPMKRDRAGAGQRPAHRRGPVLRKGRGLGQGVPRLVITSRVVPCLPRAPAAATVVTASVVAAMPAVVVPRPAARVFTPPAPRGRLRPACVRRAPSADARRCKMSSIPRSPARPQTRPPAREDTPLHTSATARTAQ